MSKPDWRHETDLIVVGGGLAGSAATAFAAECGVRTTQVGSTLGQTSFASGVLDLLGIYPTSLQKRWDDPWAGIEALVNDNRKHPYATVGIESIHKAWDSFLDILGREGLHYCGWSERNATLATCAGTLKTTFQVPRTMWPGVLALEEKRATLIIDFQGMKEFSGVQMVEALGARWAGLRFQRLKFPSAWEGGDLQNVLLAEELSSPKILSAVADAVRPFLGNAEMVGMPALLGLRQSEAVMADLERMVGAPVFEIPTMPPSVPGLRLKEALERAAMRNGAVVMHGMKAVGVETRGRRCISISVDAGETRLNLEARGVVLATGRFLGGGLAASRSTIRETLFDLPVRQPERREDWHFPHFLDPRGHPVNQAGLEVDVSMRPLGRDGEVAYENVFAAGSLLAHQDWVRMKCGAGLSIATAYAAIQSFLSRFRCAAGA